MSTLSNFLSGVADAIKNKLSISDTIAAQDFAAKINSIQVGVDTSDATATAADILASKTAYTGG